jgi:tRNA(fMet)-specific endonuclease VapC
VKLVLDTNAYRAFLEGRGGVVEKVQRADVLVLPVPVMAELRAGFAHGTRGRQNEAVLARFLDSPRVEVVPCDADTTVFYAQLYAQLRRQGTPIPINDVWIAALTLQHHGELLTFDADFDALPQLPRA